MMRYDAIGFKVTRYRGETDDKEIKTVTVKYSYTITGYKNCNFHTNVDLKMMLANAGVDLCSIEEAEGERKRQRRQVVPVFVRY